MAGRFLERGDDQIPRILQPAGGLERVSFLLDTTQLKSPDAQKQFKFTNPSNGARARPPPRALYAHAQNPNVPTIKTIAPGHEITWAKGI